MNRAPGFESPTAPIAMTMLTPARWALLARIRFYTGVGDEYLEVPPDFECDLASSPSPVRAVFPQHGVYLAAVWLHDYCYRVLIPAGEMTYRGADAMFLAAMASLGVPALRRYSMWSAVRLAGLFRGRAARAGWSGDALLVLPVALLMVPLTAGAGVVTAVTLAVYAALERVVEAAARMMDRRKSTDTM